MNERIRGISRTSLWAAWKAVRAELRRSSVRDVIDHLEHDINPDKWIAQLLSDIAAGRYEPRTPRRFTEAKGNGFSRRMTMPDIPDLVLYRAIADYLYRRARRFERGQVFCERSAIPADLRDYKQSLHPSLKVLDEWLTDYESASRKGYRAWLIYTQYRKWMLFRRVHKFVVVADIANFFDSILYSRVADSLSRLGISARISGLLFFLLERLSARDAYSESPRIGLPVDEFSCSRKLAHILLYPHDERMIAFAGTESYVRWMDDQNIGVQSRSYGLACLAEVSESLGRLHLTANSKKSLVLPIAAARRYFHFKHNEELDKAEELLTRKPIPRRELGRRVNAVYRRCRPDEGVGQWEKVLKRLYWLAAIAQARVLRRRALADVLAFPRLAERIAAYIHHTGSTAEYLTFARAVWEHGEQVYPDVSAVVFERLLRLETTAPESRELAALSSRVIRGKETFRGVERCYAIAPLLLLRFGSRRQASILRTALPRTSGAAARSVAVIYSGFGSTQAREVERAAATSLRNPLAELVLMCRAVKRYKEVPGRWGLRTQPAFDSITRSQYLDMRGIAAIRLLGLNSSKAVRGWLRDKRTAMGKTDLSDFDRRLIRRLWPV